MGKQFIEAMFCINGRVSLTKTGAAVKSFSVAVGASLSGVAFLMDNKIAAGVLIVATAALTAIGNWIKECGERNAIEKNKL